MKIKRLSRRSKWEPQRVSMHGVDTNTLSLILTNAKENIQRDLAQSGRDAVRPVLTKLLTVIDQIEKFIDSDDPWAQDETELSD